VKGVVLSIVPTASVEAIGVQSGQHIKKMKEGGQPESNRPHIQGGFVVWLLYAYEPLQTINDSG